jgi:Co/Zn/Cd efflux system component
VTDRPRVNVQAANTAKSTLSLRKVVIIVAVLNLAYFGVEFAVALTIGSVSLLRIASTF